MKKAYISIDAVDGKRLKNPEIISWYLMDDNATAEKLAEDFTDFVENYTTFWHIGDEHMRDCTAFMLVIQKIFRMGKNPEKKS